jgi:hypothetical protein
MRLLDISTNNRTLFNLANNSTILAFSGKRDSNPLAIAILNDLRMGAWGRFPQMGVPPPTPHSIHLGLLYCNPIY